MPIITRENTKLYLGITSTTQDALIDALIPQIESDFLLIRNKEFDVDSNDYVDYPDGSELVSAQMIGYQMSLLANQGGGLDFQAESIGDYSYSRAAGGKENYVNGYPKSLIGRIERFMKMR